jgi:hypothetical protein
MSTPAPTTLNTDPPGPPAQREIKLIGHSPLFYWWPVWVFGFFMAAWTAIENTRMATLPPDTTVTKGDDQLAGGVQTYTLRTKHAEGPKPLAKAVELTNRTNIEPGASPEPPFPTRVSQHAWLGTVFVFVLLLTITITNVPLRGLWSFLAISLLVVIALFITVFHGWDLLFERVANLRVYLNLSGYLFISTVVFVLWAMATFIFDRRTFMIITPGQIKVCEHIGDSVRTYDTVGMTFEKQRDDIFRHYILGFGSGDLVVRTAGAERHEIRLQNVLGIGWKMRPIEDMLRERAVVQ